MMLTDFVLFFCFHGFSGLLFPFIIQHISFLCENVTVLWTDFRIIIIIIIVIKKSKVLSGSTSASAGLTAPFPLSFGPYINRK